MNLCLLVKGRISNTEGECHQALTKITCPFIGTRVPEYIACLLTVQACPTHANAGDFSMGVNEISVGMRDEDQALCTPLLLTFKLAAGVAALETMRVNVHPAALSHEMRPTEIPSELPGFKTEKSPNIQTCLSS